MHDRRQFFIVLRVKEPGLQARLLKHLNELPGTSFLPSGYRTEVVVHNDDHETYRWFRHEIDHRPENCAILISDDLVEGEVLQDETWTYLPKSFAKELIVDGLFATIAVMKSPQRVVDIDRTVAADCTRDEFRHALALCAAKLGFMLPPRKQKQQLPIQIRRISNKAELSAYFRLRHEAYTVMGYLQPEIERAPSGLEINWNDRNAIHLGAFLRQPNRREHLVGTARLALMPLSPKHAEWATMQTFEQWTDELAQSDPILSRSINQPLSLTLPIFHSVRKLLSPEIFHGASCGELSRIIVANDFRGAGISSKLTRAAIDEARKAGIERLFLECLPLHMSLYSKMGFRVFEADARPVIYVKKTMVPMELRLEQAGHAVSHHPA